MKPTLAIIPVMLLTLISVSLRAQDDTVKIQPGIQWDTAIVVKPTHKPEHLIGVRYDYSFTGVSMTPEMGTKSINSPVNIAVLYTYYHPLWSVIDIFGIQTGLRYTRYGFVNSEYNFERFQQTVSVIELPLISAFHVDIGEHCRIRNCIIDKHNVIPRGTIIGYDREEDAKRYPVVDLGPEYGPDAWLTVIPKDRHYQMLELPKSLETHQL